VKPPRGRLLNSHQAAEYLGVSVHKMRRLIASREVSVLRTTDGRFEGIYEQDCEVWVQRHREPAFEDGRERVSPASADVDAQMQRLIRDLEAQ
jgi:excisionase family DNA binding protein